MRFECRVRAIVNAPESDLASSLSVGGIEIANRVMLAPMSGITDVPFRRQVAELGAGLVVSEMTASDDLAQGRPMTLLRAEATGVGPHVVQLAGCETRWMAEGRGSPKPQAPISSTSTWVARRVT